jgi:hypothetical protein
VLEKTASSLQHMTSESDDDFDDFGGVSLRVRALSVVRVYVLVHVCVGVDVRVCGGGDSLVENEVVLMLTSTQVALIQPQVGAPTPDIYRGLRYR